MDFTASAGLFGRTVMSTWRSISWQMLDGSTRDYAVNGASSQPSQGA
jgi:hypothetical protein